MVDVARLVVYGAAMLGASSALRADGVAGLVGLATGCAFVGAFTGVRLLGKITLTAVRRVVGLLLTLVGAAMATGVI